MRPNKDNDVHLGLKTIFLYKNHLGRLQNKYFNRRHQAQKNFFWCKKKFFYSNFFYSKIFWKLKNWKSRLASSFWQFFSRDCRCQNINDTSKIMPELDQATLKRHNMRLLGPNLELYFWPPYTGPYTGIFHPRVAV